MHSEQKQQKSNWEVYFGGSFWGHSGSGHAGTERSVGSHFYWDREEWIIPSIYSCSDGLVIDFIKKISIDSIRHFTDKWHLTSGSSDEDFSDEQLLSIQLDNPLVIGIGPEIILNGETLPCSNSCSICWNPLLPENKGDKIHAVIEHYHLDPSFGWAVCRSSFPWRNGDLQICSLSVQIQPEPQEIPGPRFHVNASGSQFSFIYSPTGTRHTLTVQEYTVEQIPKELYNDTNREFPSCVTIMGYTLHPALPPHCLTLSDCAGSDKPRIIHAKPLKDPESYTESDIIGGADGPTAIFLSKPDASKHILYAASSAHFEPVMDVEWRMTFHEQLKSDICVDLI